VESHRLFISIAVALALLSSAILSPAAASPYLAISEDQWQDALDTGMIASMGAAEWAQYMAAWQHPDEGPPYPHNEFHTAELYLYPGAAAYSNIDIIPDGTINFPDVAALFAEWLNDTLIDGGEPPAPAPLADSETRKPYDWPECPGLVMAWGPAEKAEDTSTSSGEEFKYGEDPDLTNAAIAITVQPTAGVNIVSVGIKDENGKIKAWYWNVGNPGDGDTVIAGEKNRLTVYASSNGIQATDPQATSFTADDGFDLTRVVSLIVGENYTSLPGEAVPPPGQTREKAWSCFYDISVSPNEPNEDPGPFKWRQPARYIANNNNYFGWDEISVHDKTPLLADDWPCNDDRPVTAINWWGSFKVRPADPGMAGPGWIAPVLPPTPPSGFHIAIWTDVPGHVQDITIFSHPDEMIWEQTCRDYRWEFVGFDRDPVPTCGAPPGSPVDACFRFSVDLNPNFAQDPDNNSVYWLTIAAIYDDDPLNPPEFEWGWKTRPHFFNDQAVRITALDSSTWPPTAGDKWTDGTPVQLPQSIPWDLSFELITAEIGP